MILSMAIRQRIINLSKSKNINLKKVSTTSNISYSTLTGFMSGATKTINLSTLYKICLGFDIALVDFFDDKIFIDVLDEHEKNINSLLK